MLETNFIKKFEKFWSASVGAQTRIRTRITYTRANAHAQGNWVWIENIEFLRLKWWFFGQRHLFKMEGNKKISFGTCKEHSPACCVFFIFLNIAFATKLQQLMCQFGILNVLFYLIWRVFGVGKIEKIKKMQHEAVSCDCNKLHVSVSLLILIFLRWPKKFG